MKKQLLLGMVLAAMSLLPSTLFAQSTQGTDFWVTFMRGDRGKSGTDNGYDKLLLKFSAQEATTVYIKNEYTEYEDSVKLGDNDIQELLLNNYASSCYVTDDDEETPSNHAIHVTSDKPISLIAANYKNKSFDVAAILPTKALLSEYRIQCYSPSAHKEDAGHFPHGSHFAIVAAEDNVVVDITPTARTHGKGRAIGETFATDTLQKGQVYYVWSGPNEGPEYDFTGTVIKARGNKKIAVFNGNSHTNIPIRIKDRDHIYSQAMPVNYWGKRFAITSSLTTIDNQKEKTSSDYKKLNGYYERIDKIRVQALVDSTVVWIDGQIADTIAFNDPNSLDHQHHFFEFDFGKQETGKTAGYNGDGHDFYDGVSHYIETSCPSAVHLFLTSNQYDHNKTYKEDGVEYKYCNGDPSEIWVNPIEQKIKTLTFGTFETQQVTDHFLNIVTTKDNVASVRLDGNDISGQFQDLLGNSEYMFTRVTGLENGTHTLSSDSGFIAHVYGFGQRESYGYPAGGETKDLTAFITINGKVYRADGDNKICGDDKVTFGCELNYEYDSIYWNFGDGKDSLMVEKADSVEHFYDQASVYNAYVLIYRHMGEDDGCINFSNTDSIAFKVNIGNYQINIKDVELPYCSKEGDEVDMTIILENPAEVVLSGDSVTLQFNADAIAAGFKEDQIRTQGDTALIVKVPSGAKNRTEYGLHMHIGSECPNSVFDKDLNFTLTFDIPVLEQRYNNVLGVRQDSFPTQDLSDFVWIHDGDTLYDQRTSVLYLDETNPENKGEYYVCFTIKEQGQPDSRYCTCPIAFKTDGAKHSFDTADPKITAVYEVSGDKVFVNAQFDEENKDIECYAQWYDVSGRALEGGRFDLPNGGRTIEAPRRNGLYLLRVVTGKATRSFKFIINH